MTELSAFAPVPVAAATVTEPLVFLLPEEIRVPEAGKPARSEQNRVLRLAAAIKRYGVLEPLSVRRSEEEESPQIYELLEGERRFEAAMLAGIRQIPCRILPENHPKCAETAIFARFRQGNSHFFEQAAAIERLMREFHLTQDEIARRLSLSQSAVANKLRLLRLAPYERETIRQSRLSERHARALLRLSTPEDRTEILQKVLREGLTVAATEALIDEKQAKMPSGQGGVPPVPVKFTRESASPAVSYAAYRSAQGNLCRKEGEIGQFGGRQTPCTLPWDTRIVVAQDGAGERDAAGAVLAPETERVPEEAVHGVGAEYGAGTGRAVVETACAHETKRETAAGRGVETAYDAESEATHKEKAVSEPAFVRSGAAEAPDLGGKPPIGVRKIAIRDLRPLYNSIEHSLDIFRRTGIPADCVHEESPNCVRIVISIPWQTC